MPELPEVESARRVLAGAALGRVIVDVDDRDSFVCRPHPPGAIRAALLGRSLDVVHRQGKSLWCETEPAGPVLGIHLGMSGKIVVAAPDGTEVDGGDYWRRARPAGEHRWARFALGFADGGGLWLDDPRRLARVRLDPPVDRLGPDAATATPGQLRQVLATGTAPVKARLLDQHAVAGIGNLLADEILWRAKVFPGTPVTDLTDAQRRRIVRAVPVVIADAVRDGGVHTLTVVPFRNPGGRCPRDGAVMTQGRFGGRTTWWCSREQRI